MKIRRSRIPALIEAYSSPPPLRRGGEGSLGSIFARLGQKAASLAVIVLVAAAATTGAHAADITRTFDVVASDFGEGAPYSSVTLDFTLSFDPTVATNTTTNGLAISNFTLPDSSEFDYAPLLQFGSLFSLTDVLTVGTDVISPEIGGAIVANQYILAIDNTASATPQLDYFE